MYLNLETWVRLSRQPGAIIVPSQHFELLKNESIEETRVRPSEQSQLTESLLPSEDTPFPLRLFGFLRFP